MEIRNNSTVVSNAQHTVTISSEHAGHLALMLSRNAYSKPASAFREVYLNARESHQKAVLDGKNPGAIDIQLPAPRQGMADLWVSDECVSFENFRSKIPALLSIHSETVHGNSDSEPVVIDSQHGATWAAVTEDSFVLGDKYGFAVASDSRAHHRSVVVRDYGAGMSREEIVSLVGGVGNSTKRGDNTFGGGFGIGSLAPLYVSDVIHIRSWNNGMHTYAIVAASGGNVSVTIAAHRAYDEAVEKSGVEVSFTLRDDVDVDAFSVEALMYLAGFGVSEKFNVVAVSPAGSNIAVVRQGLSLVLSAREVLGDPANGHARLHAAHPLNHADPTSHPALELYAAFANNTLSAQVARGGSASGSLWNKTFVIVRIDGCIYRLDNPERVAAAFGMMTPQALAMLTTIDSLVCEDRPEMAGAGIVDRALEVIRPDDSHVRVVVIDIPVGRADVVANSRENVTVDFTDEEICDFVDSATRNIVDHCEQLVSEECADVISMATAMITSDISDEAGNTVIDMLKQVDESGVFITRIRELRARERKNVTAAFDAYVRALMELGYGREHQVAVELENFHGGSASIYVIDPRMTAGFATRENPIVSFKRPNDRDRELGLDSGWLPVDLGFGVVAYISPLIRRALPHESGRPDYCGMCVQLRLEEHDLCLIDTLAKDVDRRVLFVSDDAKLSEYMDEMFAGRCEQKLQNNVLRRIHADHSSARIPSALAMARVAHEAGHDSALGRHGNNANMRVIAQSMEKVARAAGLAYDSEVLYQKDLAPLFHRASVKKVEKHLGHSTADLALAIVPAKDIDRYLSLHGHKKKDADTNPWSAITVVDDEIVCDTGASGLVPNVYLHTHRELRVPNNELVIAVIAREGGAQRETLLRRALIAQTTVNMARSLPSNTLVVVVTARTAQARKNITHSDVEAALVGRGIDRSRIVVCDLGDDQARIATQPVVVDYLTNHTRYSTNYREKFEQAVEEIVEDIALRSFRSLPRDWHTTATVDGVTILDELVDSLRARILVQPQMNSTACRQISPVSAAKTGAWNLAARAADIVSIASLGSTDEPLCDEIIEQARKVVDTDNERILAAYVLATWIIHAMSNTSGSYLRDTDTQLFASSGVSASGKYALADPLKAIGDTCADAHHTALGAAAGDEGAATEFLQSVCSEENFGAHGRGTADLFIYITTRLAASAATMAASPRAYAVHGLFSPESTPSGDDKEREAVENIFHATQQFYASFSHNPLA